MKTVKKIMIGVSLCLLLGLMIPAGGSITANAAENTTQVGFEAQGAGNSVDPDRVTTVNKGTAGSGTQNKPVQTGDYATAGRYAILLIGSAVLILLLLLVNERKEVEENRF